MTQKTGSLSPQCPNMAYIRYPSLCWHRPLTFALVLIEVIPRP